MTSSLTFVFMRGFHSRLAGPVSTTQAKEPAIGVDRIIGPRVR